MGMIDGTDAEILSILQENCRTSNAEIARQVGLAPSGVFDRIRKLEEKGVIRGYRAEIDPKALERTLDQVRSLGYATSFGERVPGTNSIAVPLLAADGNAIGSLAILWPSRGAAEDRKRRAAWPTMMLEQVREVQGTL